MKTIKYFKYTRLYSIYHLEIIKKEIQHLVFSLTKIINIRKAKTINKK